MASSGMRMGTSRGAVMNTVRKLLVPYNAGNFLFNDHAMISKE